MNTFSILESYKAGWRGFKQNWLYILGAMLTLGLISSLADIYMFIKTGTLNFATGPIYSLFSLIISLVTMVLSYNFISGTLDASENKKVKNTLHALGMKKIEEEIKAIRNSDNDNI